MARTAAIMVQGTGSDVGKSVLVAGLCRLFTRRGLSVRPFKPQNMSNNAAVTCDGGEIGRAQALQARACGVAASIHMNPVLLKPEGEAGSQVVVQGRRVGSCKAREYYAMKPQLMTAVRDSYDRLGQDCDLVIVEGAGSPAEINLRAGDIANMGFAEAVDLPVIIVADIERGGVIANLVGTHAVLTEPERGRIRGFIVNKFRGDASLFDDGVRLIASRTGWPGLGVVPYFAQAGRLPAEDSVGLDLKARRAGCGDKTGVHIAVPLFARIANHDDLDPLAQEPGVRLSLVGPGRALPGDADLVILPGSKATISDLNFVRSQGWDVDLAAHVRRGGHVLGLCGGYQMLGRWLDDPHGLEGPAGRVPGLGLLDIDTKMTPNKTLVEVSGHHRALSVEVRGYEMHIGETTGPDRERPLLEIDGRGEGSCSPDGRIAGTYLHGLFASDAFRRAYLASFDPAAASDLAYDATVETTLDALADHLERYLDIASISDFAGLPSENRRCA